MNIKEKPLTRTRNSPKVRAVDQEIEPEAVGQVEPETNPLAWLTVEMVLIALIVIVGAGLRLWQLGNYPLSDVEAQQSLVAFQLANGEAIQSTNYSPLLVSLNGLAFLLFQDSGATARLASVLIGTILFLLPLTLRRQLGPAVTLIASALLAISPTALFLSRTVNSEIAVAVGALMIFAGFFNWSDSGQQRWLYLAAGGVAVALTAGPLGYSIIVIFAVVILIKLAAFRQLWDQGLSLAAANNDIESETASDDATEAVDRFPAALKQAGLFLLAAMLILSTAAMFNLSGLSVTTNLFMEWVSRFTFQPRLDGGFNAVFLLTLYEILTVVAGLVGLTFALLSRDLLKQSLAGWFIGALILDLVMIGRPTGSVILSLVPLTLLAGLALSTLADNLQQWGQWGNEGIILAAGVIILGFGYIGLTGWLVRVCGADDRFCQLAWLQSVAAVALFLVIVFFFGFVQNDAGISLRGLAITGVVLGLIAIIGFGWRLNYGRLENLAYQPLAGIPASTEVIDMMDTLSEESLLRAQDNHLIDVTLSGATPALLWQLRNFKNVTPTGSIITPPNTTAVITLTADDEQPNLGEAYIGQDFALNSVWSPVGLPAKELINWLIYREVTQRPQRGNQAILWLRYGAG
ncbi:MAG: glycosyltransferase family 39 protein [Anaerolineales bacterium]|nr:glycosyltransferase family 39 protein [Anaerolineales bacterium]